MEDALLTKMRAGRGILVGYLPLGDPAMGDLVSRAGSFLEAGVDVLELGVPCERPVLDGAVVRGSMERALERTSAEGALASVARLASASMSCQPTSAQKRCQCPSVVMPTKICRPSFSAKGSYTAQAETRSGMGGMGSLVCAA